MNLSKKILNTIAIIISHIIIFTLCFIWDYYDNNLTTKELPYMIIFFISIIILFFAITNIAYNLSCNNKKVLYKKYQIYKIFSILDKNNHLHSFEKFCIAQNNASLIKVLSQELIQSELKNLESLTTSGDNKEIEKYLKEISNNKSKKFNKLLDDFNKPLYSQYFYEYYNNTILKKKESIFGFLIGFISFIIAIIPFFIKEIPVISWIVYSDFIDPLIFVLTDFIAIYKSNIKTISNEYDEDLKELEKSLKAHENQI